MSFPIGLSTSSAKAYRVPVYFWCIIAKSSQCERAAPRVQLLIAAYLLLRSHPQLTGVGIPGIETGMD